MSSDNSAASYFQRLSYRISTAGNFYRNNNNNANGGSANNNNNNNANGGGAGGGGGTPSASGSGNRGSRTSSRASAEGEGRSSARKASPSSLTYRNQQQQQQQSGSMKYGYQQNQQQENGGHDGKKAMLLQGRHDDDEEDIDVHTQGQTTSTTTPGTDNGGNSTFQAIAQASSATGNSSNGVTRMTNELHHQQQQQQQQQQQGQTEMRYSQMRVQAGVTHISGGQQVEQVAGELFTQVRLVRPAENSGYGRNNDDDQQQQDDEGSRGANGNNNNNGSNNNNSSDASIRGNNGSGGRGANQGNNSSRMPRVHASALIERSRQIRCQPKNTSPINTSQHDPFLPRPLSQHHGKKCLILDLDETLVHSSRNKPLRYDLHLNIQVEAMVYSIYVSFRPYLKEFLEAIAPLFELVIFTASVSVYCNPVMDAIDPHRILGNLRLYREHCSVVNGSYVKDLSLLGRPLDTVSIVDNSPIAYLFQQRNAIPITSWFDDTNDEELMRLIPVLQALAEAPTVYDVLDNYNALLQLQQEQLQAHDV